MISELLNLTLLRAVWVLGFVLAMFRPCMAQETPKFEGTSIPDPPAQSEPWSTPKNNLPSDAASAMADLFKAGLADPRECEYRQIEVVVGSCWGYSAVMKTNGWVLPSADRQRFGVCWNGLVYPLVSVGAVADLHADVSAMLKKDQAQIDEARARFHLSEEQREDEAKRQGKEYRRVDSPLRWNTNVVEEAMSIATDNMRPIKAALLLRLGETGLAEKVWSQWSGVTQQMGAYDPHLQLADDWVWALFDRSVCAHMRGDDQLALISARMLVPFQQRAADVTHAVVGTISNLAPLPKLTYLVAALSSTATGNPPSLGNNHPTPTRIYLDALPGLIADEERRIEEPAYTPILQMASPPQGRARVIGLIRDLELVEVPQMSQPGGVNLAEDPTVKALITMGDDAVEPLLDCLENDPRLTRSVQVGRDFRPSRTLLGVPDAAYAALAGILQTNFIDSSLIGDSLAAHGQEGRAEIAAKIRDFWQNYHGTPLPDRWYQILRDDQATPSHWVEAAGKIIQDADTNYGRSRVVDAWMSDPAGRADDMPPMCGETLRAKTKPTVSDLLLRRMQDLSVSTNQVYDSNLQAKTKLALILARWDGRAHFDALRDMTETLKKRIGYPHEGLESEISPILWVYKARVSIGDPIALAEYASWLPTVPRDNLDYATSMIFDIMWQYPNDPAIRQAAEKLFAGKDSPWVPLLSKKNSFALGLMSSPLVGLATFRTELLRGLSDKSVAGSVALTPNNYINVVANGGSWTTSGGSCFMDASAPPSGTILPFRSCDLCAFEISQLEGAPKYQLYWTLEKRDEIIPILAQFLQRYGDLYQYQREDCDEHDIFNKARIHFPKLDLPATQDDVDHNRAIFSLNGQARLWQMPTFPMKASWTTLKDDPEQGIQFDGKSVVAYHTDGRVFQAEELLVNGKWERFFGFVGLHHIARVPASEIEFPAQGNVADLSNGFDCEILEPGQSQLGGRITISKLGLKEALTVTLQIRNRSGLDQKVPGTILQPLGDTKKLPHAVELTLGYSPKSFETAYSIPDSEWHSVEMKKGVVVAEPQAHGPTLAPTEECAIMTIDLHDFFDLTRPGTYYIKATFHDPGWSTGESNKAIFTLSRS